MSTLVADNNAHPTNKYDEVGQLLGFQVNKSIKSYNELRPHASCDYLTPNQAHLQSEKLNKRWKKYYKNFNHEKTDL